MVRMKDVAEHAGVSVATVSNVITGKNFVSPAVKKK
ncbi:LacI family DNA-binding transcriptional regulator [Christensenella massiliensis]|uniref:LacI family DNA-binding transcriptional regulator n=1 Tax=Christensenella massiliensis TaxID=1805714 RepID=A0AAU8A5H4_9FIRM